jgi:hypothetical protein
VKQKKFMIIRPEERANASLFCVGPVLSSSSSRTRTYFERWYAKIQASVMTTVCELPAHCNYDATRGWGIMLRDGKLKLASEKVDMRLY